MKTPYITVVLGDLRCSVRRLEVGKIEMFCWTSLSLQQEGAIVTATLTFFLSFNDEAETIVAYRSFLVGVSLIVFRIFYFTWLVDHPILNGKKRPLLIRDKRKSTWRTEPSRFTHRNNERIQAVPCGWKVFHKSKSYGFQNKFQCKNCCENVVKYFQCFNKFRLLV